MIGSALVRTALGATLAASSVMAQSDAWHFDIVKTLMIARMEYVLPFLFQPPLLR